MTTLPNNTGRAPLPQTAQDPSLTLFTLDEVSQAFGVSRRTLSKYISEGRLQATRFGRYKRVTLQELRRVLSPATGSNDSAPGSSHTHNPNPGNHGALGMPWSLMNSGSRDNGGPGAYASYSSSTHRGDPFSLEDDDTEQYRPDRMRPSHRQRQTAQEMALDPLIQYGLAHDD